MPRRRLPCARGRERGERHSEYGFGHAQLHERRQYLFFEGRGGFCACLGAACRPASRPSVRLRPVLFQPLRSLRRRVRWRRAVRHSSRGLRSAPLRRRRGAFVAGRRGRRGVRRVWPAVRVGVEAFAVGGYGVVDVLQLLEYGVQACGRIPRPRGNVRGCVSGRSRNFSGA